MNLDELDRMIKEREERIEKGKKEGTLFEGESIKIEEDSNQQEGFPSDQQVPDCPQCGIMPCPQCRRCLCNIPFLTYMTLIRIHKKYCCNLPEFSGVIELNGFVDNDVIHNCEKTLKHCKSLEGL